MTLGTGSELRRYSIGAVISAILTVIPFWAVTTASVPRGTAIWIIGICAVAQIVVQLRCFLHLGWRQKREDLQLVLFSALLLAIMAGGTLWIMASLAGRMH